MYNVDVLKEMQFFCKKSERVVELSSVNNNISKGDESTIQNKVVFSENGDITEVTNQIIALGSHWFISRNKELAKGSKGGDDGNWACLKQNTEDDLQ